MTPLVHSTNVTCGRGAHDGTIGPEAIMATQQIPPCPCGGTEFDNTQTTLPLVADAGVATFTKNQAFLMRICKKCFQVTLWLKKPNQ